MDASHFKGRSVCLVSFSDFGLGRGEGLAKAMRAIGLEVLIVTNRPVYGRPSTNMRKIVNEEGISIIQVPLLPIPYSSVISRLIQYAFFTLASFLTILRMRRSFDFYYSRGPQPFTEIACHMARVFKEGRLISDITDIWPDALAFVPTNSFLKRILILFGHALNSLVYRRLDAIVTHNEVMKAILSERSGRRVDVVYGVIDMDRFKPIPKEEAVKILPEDIQDKVGGRFVVMYAGILGWFQEPEIILKLAEILRNDEILFILIGTGPLAEWLKREKEKKHLENVLFSDPVSNSLMPAIYSIADVFLLPYRQIGFMRIGLPKKLIEYAAASRPILCITPDCVASRLCVDWGAGYHVSPSMLEEAARIIRELKVNEELRKALGKNARRMAYSIFSVEAAKNRLQLILNSLK
jgi:glycosyltransferase involved in cell wall biosynthesis